MIALADIIRQYRAQLLTQYGHLMLPSHHRAMSAMAERRTGVLRSALWECQQCAATTCTPMSCGHRNFPQCQHLDLSYSFGAFFCSTKFFDALNKLIDHHI